MSDEFYIGNELDLFARAENWKRYYGSLIRQYLGQNVLEVGAGIGGTTEALCDGAQEKWLCLEPDPNLLRQIDAKIKAGILPAYCQTEERTIQNLKPDSRFDSMLYIDVLEHIEDDQAEMMAASKLVNPGGAIIVLAPAHNYLFSPFDQAIGHFRRYDKKSIAALQPPGMEIEKLVYLDTVGLLTSSANRFILKQSYPTLTQILFWDRYVITLSRLIDRVTSYKLGKSVLCIWKKV